MRFTKALRIAGDYLSFLISYVLAGGSLIATVVLLMSLYEVISQTKASYPPLRPISGSSLNKPLFLRSIPVQTPKSFRGMALSVSPDGKQIAYLGRAEATGGRGFFVASIQGEADTLIWRFVVSHQWSPDSTSLLLQAREEQQGAAGIAVASVGGDTFAWIITPPVDGALNQPLPVTAATWSADGRAVLFVQSKAGEGVSELWRHELEGGQRQRLAALPKEADKPNTYIRNLSLSPDGKKVSFINADRPGAERSSTWWIMNVDGSSPLTLMKRGLDTSFVQKWTWSPDSRQLAYDVKPSGDTGYQPTTLWIVNADGTARRQLAISENTNGVAISPKGNWLIYAKESHLWLANQETGLEEQLTFGDDDESMPMWLANGDVLYHLKVGSVSSLRLLEFTEPADIPGLATTPTPGKVP